MEFTNEKFLVSVMNCVQNPLCVGGDAGENGRNSLGAALVGAVRHDSHLHVDRSLALRAVAVRQEHQGAASVTLARGGNEVGRIRAQLRVGNIPQQ